jgi:hypothetical protein
MYQRTGQKDYISNIFTAVPQNTNNSIDSKDMLPNTDHTFTIRGRECYTCWYFITIKVNDPARKGYVNYRFTVSHVDENVSA